MKRNTRKELIFFTCFGVIAFAAFCVSAAILALGIYRNSFSVNPVYLFMVAVGSLGLLFTDIVAMAQWKKHRWIHEKKG